MTQNLTVAALLVLTVWAATAVRNYWRATSTPRRRKTDAPNHPAARHSITVTSRERLGTYTIPRPRSGADN